MRNILGQRGKGHNGPNCQCGECTSLFGVYTGVVFFMVTFFGGIGLAMLIRKGCW
jgi:hypothetical protein